MNKNIYILFKIYIYMEVHTHHVLFNRVNHMFSTSSVTWFKQPIPGFSHGYTRAGDPLSLVDINTKCHIFTVRFASEN